MSVEKTASVCPRRFTSDVPSLDLVERFPYKNESYLHHGKPFASSLILPLAPKSVFASSSSALLSLYLRQIIIMKFLSAAALLALAAG